MGLGKTYSTKYLLDSNNNSGVAGQVLSTTSTGIDWVDANTVPGSGLWLENGNDIYNSNSGNVGIGITLPQFKLQVSGSVALDVMAAFETEGTVRIGRYDVNTSRYNDIKSYVSSTAGSNYLKFAIHGGVENATVDVMTLKGNGNVGIGTDSPIGISAGAPALTLNGTNTSVGAGLIFQVNGTTKSYQYVEANILRHQAVAGVSQSFWTNSSEKMRIDTSGNVGIGVTSPSARLEVDLSSAGSSYTAPQTNSIVEIGNTTSTQVAVEIGVRLGADTLPVIQGTNGASTYALGLNPYGGNVGIGTTSPDQKLHSYITTGDIYNLIETGSNVSTAGSRYKSSAQEYFAGLQYSVNAAYQIYDITGGAARMTILSGGNVGIGTVSLLEVRASK